METAVRKTLMRTTFICIFRLPFPSKNTQTVREGGLFMLTFAKIYSIIMQNVQ